MEAIEVYRQKLQQIPALDESWFREALVAARSGYDAARRKIAGSTLGYVLRLVERRCPQESLLEHVQDANSVILPTLASFTGSSAAEYVMVLDSAVNLRLDELSLA